jgi:hypothetical protein
MAKLNMREIYDMYSITIKTGMIAVGTPSGKNKLK